MPLEIIDIMDDCKIEDIRSEKNFLIGYYLLETKKESVSAKKSVVAVSKASGEIKLDDDARIVLKVPVNGAFSAQAKDFPDHDVFIQTTSWNRVLKAPTKLLIQVTGTSGAKQASIPVPPISFAYGVAEHLSQPPDPLPSAAARKKQKTVMTSEEVDSIPVKSTTHTTHHGPPSSMNVDAPGTKTSGLSVGGNNTSSTSGSGSGDGDATAGGSGGSIGGGGHPSSAPSCGSTFTFTSHSHDLLREIPMLDDEGHSLSITDGAWHTTNDIMFKFRPLPSTPGPSSPTLEYVGFDIDSNVIKTKSGNVFPKDVNDWQLWSAGVAPKLQQLVAQGKLIVFISNQTGVGKGTGNIDKKGMQKKVEAIFAAAGVEGDFICALDDGLYRKPLTGTWDLLKLHRRRSLGAGGDVVLRAYVGDAAGRPAVGKRKKDFSDSDLKFALNAGAQFYTPDEFFNGSTDAIDLKCPSKITSTPLLSLPTPPNIEQLREAAMDPGAYTGLEIVLIIAPQACGKSFLARKFVDRFGYARANRDALKTVEKCVKVARAALTGTDGHPARSVVVDNTNVDQSARKPWLDLAEALGGTGVAVRVRCIVLETSEDVAGQLQRFRLYNPLTLTEDKRPIPGWVMTKFFKDLQVPTEAEGYARVDHLPFCLNLEGIASQSLTMRLYASFL